MPRFYLHLTDVDGLVEDTEGTEYPNVAAARKAAILGLQGVAAGEIVGGQLNLATFVEIQDEHGEYVSTVTLPEALNIEPG